MRQKGAPGAVELIEVEVTGDTVWQRVFGTEPRRLTPRMVSVAAAPLLDMLGARLPGTPRARLEAIYEERLHRPEYVPAVEGPPYLTSSGEVRLRTTELADTLRVHYAVRRGDMARPLRRVLLPEGYWLSDASDTHLWGVVLDELNVPRIVGRRLIEDEVRDPS